MKAAVYTRPAKPLVIPVRRRRDFDALPKAAPVEIVTVDKATECHVTPPEVAARMAAHLGRPGNRRTLEPSAGTGNLSRALLESGYTADALTQVERHHRLAGLLQPYGAVIQRCFLDYAAEVAGRTEFARVIMNPPFSEVRKHVAAALSLMTRDETARLVALVPVTFQHPEAEELEHLAEDTFATARVRTKIILIEREV